MSMTMKEREFAECKSNIVILKRDIENLENKIASRKKEGNYLAGRTIGFNQLVKMYEKLAEVVDDQD